MRSISSRPWYSLDSQDLLTRDQASSSQQLRLTRLLRSIVLYPPPETILTTGPVLYV